MRLFLGLGFPIGIHPALVLWVALLAAAGLGGPALVVLGSVFLHELAHAAAARVAGARVASVELYPFGGIARIDAGAEPGTEAAVAAAGPLFSFCLAAAATGLNRAGLVSPPGGLLDWAVLANLGLGAFNLLPALPLDGGRIYLGLASRRLGLARASRRLVRLGRGLAWGLAAAATGCAAAALPGLAPPGWRPVLAGLALNGWLTAAFLYRAGREERMVIARRINALLRKGDVLSRRGILPVRHLAVAATARVAECLVHFSPDAYHVVLVADGRGHLLGQLTEGQLLAALAGGAGPTLGDLLGSGPGRPPGCRQAAARPGRCSRGERRPVENMFPWRYNKRDL